jgi:hypothetical protein
MVVTLPGTCSNGDVVFHTTTSTGSSVALAMNYGLPSDVDHKAMPQHSKSAMKEWDASVQCLRDDAGMAIKGF